MSHEFLRMQKLSGVITESEYNQKIEELNSIESSTETLNENVVGVGATLNPYPTKKKEVYEAAFSKFLSEEKDEMREEEEMREMGMRYEEPVEEMGMRYEEPVNEEEDIDALVKKAEEEGKSLSETQVDEAIATTGLGLIALGKLFAPATLAKVGSILAMKSVIPGAMMKFLVAWVLEVTAAGLATGFATKKLVQLAMKLPGVKSAVEKKKAEMKEGVNEDARTDTEEEGYKDGFKDAIKDAKDAISKLRKELKEEDELEEDLYEDARTDAEEEGYQDGFKDAIKDALDALKGLKGELKEEEDMDEAMSNPDQRHKDDKGPDRGAERKSLDSEPRYNKKDTE